MTEVPSSDELNSHLLSLSDEEWYQEKARFCQDLYDEGLKHPAWSDEQAEWWHRSLLFFVEEFIQPKLPIPEFHQQWYWWSVREQTYMNLSPRDHAKTSVHAVYRTVWEICVNRNITFFIVFSTTDVAKLVLNEIKSHLSQNPRIKAGFGAFNPAELSPEERRVEQDWSQHSITVNRPDYGIKDPTVAVTGSLTNVLSRRADRLIADDLLTDKIAFSEAESTRLERWYFNDVLPVLKSDGQEIITGTPYRKGDFYGKIQERSIEEGGLYRVFVGDAIINEAQKLVLWPERWPYDKLEKQRAKLGYVRFNRNYRCRIVSDEDSPFPMIWFTGGIEEKTRIVYKGCFDTTLRLGMPPTTQRGKWLRYIVTGVDPAIGKSATSKFFGLVVLGLDLKGYIIVADIARGQYNFVGQKRLVAQTQAQWKSRYIVVESNAYQKALTEGLEEDFPFFPVVPYYTSGQRQKPDIGVPAMDVFFETGRVRIPRGNPYSIELTDILVEELHYWGRHNTSDLAMAFWFAFQRLLPEIERMGAMPPAKNLIFGDRARWENQMMRGHSGLILPRRTIGQIRTAAMNAPLSHLSPVKIGKYRRPLLQRNNQEEIK